MTAQKILITILSVVVIGYISSCLIYDADLSSITPTEIEECYIAYSTTNNPSSNDILIRLYGTWELDRSNQYLQVEFKQSNQFYIYNGNFIRHSGTYKVEEPVRNTFILRTTPINNTLDGIIIICDNAIFNKNTGDIWIRRW